MSPIHETVVEQSVKPGGVFHRLVLKFERERLYITRVALYFEKVRLLVSYKQVFESQKSVEFSSRKAYRFVLYQPQVGILRNVEEWGVAIPPISPRAARIRRGQVVFDQTITR